MAAQLHIVATPVGGIPEVLKMYPCKTFIKQLSPLGICEAVLSAITATRETLAEPRHKPHGYIEPFDWQKIAFQVEEVYHEAVAKAN